MDTNTLLLILAAIVIGYYFINNTNSFKPCDGTSDCTIYNAQDVKSSCDAICINKNQVFNGVYINNICGCEHVKEKPRNENIVKNVNNGASFVANITNIDGLELYTNVDEQRSLDDESTIFSQVVPSDTSFNNRNTLEQHEEKRLNSLIFG